MAIFSELSLRHGSSNRLSRYNSVLLGLSLFSLFLLSRNHVFLACIVFSLALCFKQMGLYYAPAIGCYLLGECLWFGGSQG